MFFLQIRAVGLSARITPPSGASAHGQSIGRGISAEIMFPVKIGVGKEIAHTPRSALFPN